MAIINTDKVIEKAKMLSKDVADTAEKVANNVTDTAIKVKDTAGEKLNQIDLPFGSDDLDSDLMNSITSYNEVQTILEDTGTQLLNQRQRSEDLLGHVESLINSIANTPKSFETEFGEIELLRKQFTDAVEFGKKELEDAKKTAKSAGAGVTAGAAVAAMAPTTAVWIATTFGTASTGTAISTLSGAAASQAALAWLGGGALAAGGGGVAAGNALLALAGPIGWGVAGVSLLASIALFTKNKLKRKDERISEIESVKNNTEQTKETLAKLQSLLYKTLSMREELSKSYESCLSTFEKDFIKLTEEKQLKLGALVNNTKSLAKLLSTTIE